MSVIEQLRKSIDYYTKSNLNIYDNAYRLFQIATNIAKEDKRYSIQLAKKVKNFANRNAAKDVRFYGLYNNVLLFLAPDDLDSYILYIEKDRPPQERFYLPRRKTLKQVVDAIQDLADDKLDELFIHMPPRVGKCLRLDADILTPNGFVKMRDIKVGDMVISNDGKPYPVTGVFPNGTKSMYRITFSDGAFIDCSPEHLWTVQTREDRRKDRRKSGKEVYRTIETKEMVKNLYCSDGKGKRRTNYCIDYMQPAEFTEHTHVIPPYLLGALLGDGSIANSTPVLHNPEPDVIKKIESVLTYGDSINPLKRSAGKCPAYSIVGCKTLNELRKLGIYGKTSYDKFIPKEYLIDSIENRLELLRGLCDTDGSVVKNTYMEYSTSSKQLADDIVFLIRSLGGRATKTKRMGKYTKDGKTHITRVNYRIFFKMNHGVIPVSSEKHLNKLINKRSRTEKRYITSIEPSEPVECQCISIASPSHLYVTDNFIVTHNTQLCTFAFCWWVCRDTERSNLYCSYADAVATGFYNGVLEVLTDPTYCHADVFPDAKIVQTNSKNNTIDLKRCKKYKSITAKGLTAGLNGQCDCDGLMMSDDLLEGIQDALSPDILNRKQTIVDNNLIPRAKMQCKKIWCGTIWSLKDPYSNRVDFLNNDKSAKNVRYRIVKLPALDEHDESNFDYLYGVGFDTAYYHMIRSKFERNDDIASWLAQYMQSPIERLGALFDTNYMNFYNGVLPNCAPDYKIGVCDVATSGTDYTVFIVAYVYNFDTGKEVYIVDVMFSDADKNITRPEVVRMTLKHQLGRATFEANNGGEFYREDIEDMLKKHNYRLNIRSKYAPTNKAKEARIWDKSPEIREFYFLENGLRSKDYTKFMQNLLSFTMYGKNDHDDAPDALALLASEINGTWKPIVVTSRSRLPI